MENSYSRPLERKLYLDALRIVAIFGVVFNHTSTYGYTLFLSATESTFFPFYIFCSVLCKIAVPIFLMISGALLLRKDEPISVLLKKRFLKFLVVLVVSSLILHLFYLKDIRKFSLSSFLQELYGEGATTSYWYLYAFLAYILILPFLRKIAKNMQPRDYLYLVALMFFCALLSCLEFAIWDYKVHIHSNFEIFTISRIIFYPLIGDYLANKLDDKKLTGKAVLLLCAIGFVFTVVNCWLTCRWCEHLGEWNVKTFETFITKFIFFPSMAVFVAARYIFSKIQLKASVQKGIAYVGSCTFGIYLFERVYRSKTMFLVKALSYYMPRFLACGVWVLCVCLIGFCVTAIAKKIPVIRNYL